MVNDLGFAKNAAILNEIVSQATGRKLIAPINREQFVAVGQLGLKAGYDPLLNAISSVMGRTIFSVRPYEEKFKGLRKNTQQFGDQTRKLSMMDSDWEENTEYDLNDGDSVDMYKIKKEHVLQTNYYGWQTYSRTMMIWRNQINVALSGPEEFNRFMGMKLQNVHDQIKQGNEEFARQAVVNLIGAILFSSQLTPAIHPERVINLRSNYNAYAGTNLSYTDMLKPDNIIDFAKYFYAAMADLIKRLGERTVLFHQNPKDSEAPLTRHSPRSKLKCYMYAPFMTLLDTAVHSEIFHNEYLKFMDYEAVSYWQSVSQSDNIGSTGDSLFTDQRTAISGSVAYLSSNGIVNKGQIGNTDSGKSVYPIVGVIFDEEACGYTVFDEHVNRTPWNAAGDYAKVFFKYTNRYWNDFTENAVVLTLW